MTDVFLSYRNLPDRRALVERLAAILEAHGFDVWWDYGLEAGEAWREQVLRKLQSAKVVSPLWCARSVMSEWVLKEAEIGRHKLVPVRVQEIAPPNAFEAIQAADLSGWDGGIDHDPLRRFIESVAVRVGAEARPRASLMAVLRQATPLAPLTADGSPSHNTAGARLRVRLGDAPSLADLRRYAESFPGEDAFEARSLIESLEVEIGAFEVARRANTSESYSAFLRDHPTARQAGEARSVLSQLAFETARRANSPDAYNTFLRHHSSAPQAHEARALLAMLPPDGRLIAVLKGHEASVCSASFSANGKRLVTWSVDKETYKSESRLWDAASLREIAVLPGGAAFSPDGARIVADGFGRNEVGVWDAATGCETAVLRGHEDFLRSACFSPDGTGIVTSSDDKTARVWDNAGREIAVLRGHRESLSCASFNSDGTRVVTAAYDHTARVWNAATGREVARVDHGDHSGSINACFSPNGTHAVSAIEKQSTYLWDARDGRVVEIFYYVADLSFSPDGTRVAVASNKHYGDRSVIRAANVIDTATGRSLLHLHHERDVLSASFSPDGTRIATDDGSAVRLWDCGSFEPEARGDSDAVRLGHGRGATFSPDGARIVTLAGHTAHVWNAATGRELGVLRGHEGPVLCASFSPDGARIITGSADKTARIWEIAG